MYFERIINTCKKFCYVIKSFKTSINSCKSLWPWLTLFQNSRLTAMRRQLWNKHSADNDIYWFTAWCSHRNLCRKTWQQRVKTSVWCCSYKTEQDKSLNYDSEHTSYNHSGWRQPLMTWQLWLWKHSLLEFSSSNKPFQGDWILWDFPWKRKCCKNFPKATQEESNCRGEKWSILQLSH